MADRYFEVVKAKNRNQACTWRMSSLFHSNDLMYMKDEFPKLGTLSKLEYQYHNDMYMNDEPIEAPELREMFVDLRDNGKDVVLRNHPYVLAVIKRLTGYVNNFNSDEAGGSDPRDFMNIFEWSMLTSFENHVHRQRLQEREHGRAQTAADVQEKAAISVEKAKKKAARDADPQRWSQPLGTPLPFNMIQSPPSPPMISHAAAQYGLKPQAAALHFDTESSEDSGSTLGASDPPRVPDRVHPSRPFSAGIDQSKPTPTGQMLADAALKKNLPPQWTDSKVPSRSNITSYLQAMEKGIARIREQIAADLLQHLGDSLCRIIGRTAEQAGRGRSAHDAWVKGGCVGADPEWKALPPQQMFPLLYVLFEQDVDKRSAQSVAEVMSKFRLKLDPAEPELISQALNDIERTAGMYEVTENLPDKTGWGDPPQLIKLLEQMNHNIILERPGEPGQWTPATFASAGPRDLNLRNHLWKKMNKNMHECTSVYDWTQSLYNEMKFISNNADFQFRLGYTNHRAATTVRDEDLDKVKKCNKCKVKHLIGVHLTADELATLQQSRQSQNTVNLSSQKFSKNQLKRFRQILANTDAKADAYESDQDRPSKRLRAMEKGRQQQAPYSGRQPTQGNNQSSKKRRRKGRDNDRGREQSHYGPGTDNGDRRQSGGRQSRR